MPFEAASVRAWARELAQKPYKPPDNKLPDALKDLTYDRYRMIRFKPDQALWRNEGLPFQLQFFHRGFYYANRVDIFEVKDGLATPDRLLARHVHIRRTTAGRQDPRQSRFRGLPHPRADQPARLFRRDRRVSRRELFPRRCEEPHLWTVGARAFAQHRRSEGRGISQLPLLLGRAAREGRKLAGRARPARQRKRGCGLSFHHPAGRDHDLRHRGDAVSARADRADRARLAHQHVLLRPQRSPRRRRFPPRGPRQRRPRDPERARRADLAPAQQPRRPSGQRLRRQ